MSAVHSQSLYVVLTVISANVEGLTAGKASIHTIRNVQGAELPLSLSPRNIPIQRQAKPRILGLALVAERPHNKHGSSVFS